MPWAEGDALTPANLNATVPSWATALSATDGSATTPPYNFSSETSLGWYRSAASHMALSYGTLSASALSVGRIASSGSIKADTKVVVGSTSVGVAELTDDGGSGRVFLTSEQNEAKPDYSFSANTSTGMYQAAVNVVGLSSAGVAKQWVGGSYVSLSGVTLDLSRAKLSLATTGTAITTANLGVDEVKLFIGGASGATLAVRSGGTIYFFGSSTSAAG